MVSVCVRACVRVCMHTCVVVDDIDDGKCLRISGSCAGGEGS